MRELASVSSKKVCTTCRYLFVIICVIIPDPVDHICTKIIAVIIEKMKNVVDEIGGVK